MTYDITQLRGALLEEAILYMLKSSGYKPVVSERGDDTLHRGASGLEVKGRGSLHQIDAISDFMLTPPFSNPQRLLIEAKFYSSKIGLPLVRNATGVLKDVSENWVIDFDGGRKIAKKRYHYLYAIFSSSDFSKPAQDYAYAQDIYLLPLRRSAYFSPVIQSIENVETRTYPPMQSVRKYVRSRLLSEMNEIGENEIPSEMKVLLDGLINVCMRQSFGFITMFGGRFPAFLMASPDFRPKYNEPSISVRIRMHDQTWFIEDTSDKKIFSFDLPEEIFALYATRGRLDREAVADIKSSMMREFYAFYRRDDELRLLRFKLDEEWFETIQRNLRRNG